MMHHETGGALRLLACRPGKRRGISIPASPAACSRLMRWCIEPSGRCHCAMDAPWSYGALP